MTNKRGQIVSALGNESGAQHSDYHMLVSTTEEYQNISNLVWVKLQALGYCTITPQRKQILLQPIHRSLLHHSIHKR